MQKMEIDIEAEWSLGTILQAKKNGEKQHA